jgi:hypothetical protein
MRRYRRNFRNSTRASGAYVDRYRRGSKPACATPRTSPVRHWQLATVPVSRDFRMTGAPDCPPAARQNETVRGRRCAEIRPRSNRRRCAVRAETLRRARVPGGRAGPAPLRCAAGFRRSQAAAGARAALAVRNAPVTLECLRCAICHCKLRHGPAQYRIPIRSAAARGSVMGFHASCQRLATRVSRRDGERRCL